MKMVNAQRVCSVEGCGSQVLAKTLCRKHYERKRRTGSTDAPVRAKDSMCHDCGLRWAALRSGMCRVCHLRRQRQAARENEQRHTNVRCSFCGADFSTQRRRSQPAFCSVKCKAATRAADGRAAESARRHYYKSQYGLTLEEAEDLRRGGCAICGSTGMTGRWGGLHIDHDHATGLVRGALCHNCNAGVGRFQDDPSLLIAAASYLERHRAGA